MELIIRFSLIQIFWTLMKVLSWTYKERINDSNLVLACQTKLSIILIKAVVSATTLMNAKEDALKAPIMDSVLLPRNAFLKLRFTWGHFHAHLDTWRQFDVSQNWKKNPSMMREGGFYSRDDENPFKNFVKVYQPYCTSDIHQGTDSQPLSDCIVG